MPTTGSRGAWGWQAHNSQHNTELPCNKGRHTSQVFILIGAVLERHLPAQPALTLNKWGSKYRKDEEA
ncbi:hypothetical protein GCM10011495_31200 [Hymenobacter frigidus]|uniref:Uncharacterized protein n=1 Tax=Hymenobacter frigidus TaxID=1524095 RepID=A0ABQ2ACD0_9BACT|nr:hypothetical protein GCM10011495_31200 [Hymenobacter frigidus]